MTIKFGKKTIKTQKSSNKKIFFSLYFFVLIFAPPFVPYPHLWLTIVSFFLLITRYRKRAKKILNQSGIQKWILTMTVLAGYTLCIPIPISMFCNDIVNISHYISVINRYGVLLVTVSICGTYLFCTWERRSIDENSFIECIINAGLIEAMCAILAFLSPAVKTFFIFFMSRFSESRLYFNTWYITVRSYGFASTLVDVFGFGVGLIAGLCFHYGIFYNKIYIFESIIIAIPALLNSRTGVLIYLFAIMLSVYYVAKIDLKKTLKVIVSISFLLLLGKTILDVVYTNEYTASWVKSGFKSISDYLKGKASNDRNDAIYSLFNVQSWEVPTFPRILFGTGHSLYGATGYRHSDIGYINEVWLFGIIGCLFLYSSIIRQSFRMINSNKAFFQLLGFLVLSAYFFFNIKGTALGYNPGAVTMFLLIFSITYFNNKYINRSVNDAKIGS